MQRLAVWWGTDEELKELRAAVERNCDCNPAMTCGAHEMLADQRILNHLVFVKKVRRAFCESEFALR